VYLIDSHCHLDAAEFDSDREQVIQRSLTAGVAQQIVPAVAFSNWPRLKQVCLQTSGLFPAYGLHPMYLAEHRPEHIDRLRQWIEQERPHAIGECGLDFHVDGLDPILQQHYFEAQLQLALAYDLPVIIHARRALDMVIGLIHRTGSGLRGVVHSFSGSPEQMAQLFKLGFLIGIGGPVTYERAQRLRRLMAVVPLEQLLLETDSPDQPDAGIRGQRNEPARLAVILETVAGLRNQPAIEIARQTAENARKLFSLPSV
jgi:TatD DNase family protein